VDTQISSGLLHGVKHGALRRLAVAVAALGALTGCSSGHSHPMEDYGGRVKTIDAPTMRIWIDEGRDFTIVDVRSEGEYDSDGHAPGSALHPWSIYNRDAERNKVFLEEMKAAFSPDATLVLLCSHGMRASQAAAALQEQAGFTSVYVFPGGFEGHHMQGYPGGEGWKAAGLPVEDW
jgi:rhodanese-related sulfurtransferase